MWRSITYSLTEARGKWEESTKRGGFAEGKIGEFIFLQNL